MKQQEKGIAHLGIILAILLVIAAIAFGGWYVWHQNKDDESANTNNPNQAQKENTQKQGEEEADPSEGGKYLVIEEWGVRFELPEELRGDVKYGIETSDDRQTAWFEIGKLASLPGSECSLTEAVGSGTSGEEGGVGAFLVRTPDRIPESETAYYYKPATNLQIGSHWFTGGRERYSESCVNDADKEQLVADTRASLVYALEKLEKVQ